MSGFTGVTIVQTRKIGAVGFDGSTDPMVILARCLLRRGCKGYLAHIVDTRSSEVRLEGVPVVRDLLDVFPDYLPGLPPE